MDKKMGTIDHSNTMVLLIGASDFPRDPKIQRIPNVQANLNDFRKSLTDPEIIGIPESNISVSINDNRSQIERKLRDIAEKTRNKNSTLLVYYTGHGIMSSEDYQLYLTTHETSRQDLEIDGINIEKFKQYIKKSVAGRKIVILDCCHSGAIIGSMNDMPSKIQAELNGFEGTYVMTSAAEDTPSLFPVENPEKPTYFTGKLIDIVNEGLDNDHEYCSLRDLYNKIESDFKAAGLPCPQQSNFNTADQLYFSRNRKFLQQKEPDQLAWEDVLTNNTKWGFIDFKKKFPLSPYIKEAKQRIYDIEDEELWYKASSRSTLYSLDDYLENYPDGKHADEASQRINNLRQSDEKEKSNIKSREENLWKEVSKKNNVESYEEYLRLYPFGKFIINAKTRINDLKEKVNNDLKEIYNDQNDEPLNNATEYNIRGVSYYNKQKYYQAIKDYSKAIEMNPKYAQAYYNRALVYYDQVQYDQALQDYNKAINFNQNDADVYNNRGLVYFKKGQYDLAMQDYDKALQVDRNYFKAYINRGLNFYEHRQYIDAIKEYGLAIKLNPAYALTFYNRGLAYYDQGQYDGAIVDYSKAIELNPKYDSAYYNRGLAYYDQGKYDQAIQDYRKAIEINQLHSKAHYSIGLVYYDLKQYEEAKVEYSKAIELNPKDSDAFYNRALACRGLEESDNAIKDYSRTIELDPNYVRAFLNRGVIYYEKNQYAEAIEEYTRCIELNPNYDLAYFNRGLAKRLSKDLKGACQDLKNAADLGYEDGQKYYNLYCKNN